MNRTYYYGETVFGLLSGKMTRCMVIRQSETWTKVCVGFEGHCTAIYSRVRTATILPLPSTGDYFLC